MRLQPEPRFEAEQTAGALTVDFRAGGNAGPYRRIGWAEPEAEHTWTIGPESRLELPRPSLPGPYRMVLDLGPFVWPQKLPVQRLTVSVNGRELGDFFIREVTRIECAVPWEIIEHRERLAVVFRHPGAARPSEFSGAADQRAIALAFQRLLLCPQAEPPQLQPLRDRHISQPPVSRPADPLDPETLPLDQLMLQFESLGENCEFGLAQRRCGADPLGLLRFASVPMPALLSALRARFDGIGEWDQIEIRISENQLEYLVFDKRFGFLYHPWVLIGEAAAESIHRREAKQLPRLRRKLIEDLEEGRKIFIYHGMQPLPEPLVRRLSDAMRAYGPATLLWVEPEDAEHPAGTVEPIGEGLLKGYIDRFAPGENAHDLSVEGWVALCRAAWAEARRGR